MSKRLSCAGLVPVALLLAGLAAPAADHPVAKSELVTTTYAVADLVIPIDTTPRRVVVGKAMAEPAECEKTPSSTPATQEGQLIKLITNTVCPRSWGEMGGPGTIDYFPLTMSLVITQTPDVQEQVADLLAALRRLQDQEVAFEVRLATVAPEVFERLTGGGMVKWVGPAPGQPGQAVLSDAQLFQFMEALQGDARTNVMQAPKLTLFSGQHSEMCVADEQTFLTGVTVTVEDGKVVATPKTESFPCGIEVALHPVISADRRSVRTDLRAAFKSVDTSAPLIPVSLPAWVPDSDCEGKPEMWTQFLQHPRPQTQVIKKTFAVADGQTVVFDGGTRCTQRKGCEPCGPPVLSEAPFLNRLFVNVGRQPEKEHLLLLVTPRVVVHEEKEERVTAVKPEEVEACVARLMKSFNEAYKEGKYAEAETFAHRALELAPDNPLCTAALKMAHVRQRRCAAAPPVDRCAAAEPEPYPVIQGRKEKAAALVAKYHKACAAGQVGEARKLALKALALDPTCFGKD
jgi:hypothetical protein